MLRSGAVIVSLRWPASHPADMLLLVLFLLLLPSAEEEIRHFLRRNASQTIKPNWCWCLASKMLAEATYHGTPAL
jgi:hypothetical protein